MRYGAYTSSLLVALAGFLWLTPAAADPVYFDYSASGCTDCSGLGLPVGTPLTFQVVFESGDLAPNAILDTSDVKAYFLEIGSFLFTDTMDLGLRFGGKLNATADSFLTGTWFFTASKALDPNIGDTIALNWAGWFVGEGNCNTSACTSSGQTALAYSYPADFSDLSLQRDDIGTPEPLTASLFVAGLLGLGLGRRQKHN